MLHDSRNTIDPSSKYKKAPLPFPFSHPSHFIQYTIMPRAPRTILPCESLPYAAYQYFERLAAELAEHGNEGTYQIGPAVYVHLTRTHASIMMALLLELHKHY